MTVTSIWRETRAIAHAHFSSFATLLAALYFLPNLVLTTFWPTPMPDFSTTPPTTASYDGAHLLAAFAISLTGWFVMLTIIAITVNYGRAAPASIATTLRQTVKPMLKLIAAALLVYVGLTVVLTVCIIVLAVIGGFIASASGVSVDPKSPILIVVIVAAILMPMLWVALRLAPLQAVYLDPARAPLGVIAGIRRAWALSRGSALTILWTFLLWFGAAAILALAFYGLNLKFGLMSGPALPRLLVQLAILPVSLAITLYFSVALGVLYRQLTANEAPAALRAAA